MTDFLTYCGPKKGPGYTGYPVDYSGPDPSL